MTEKNYRTPLVRSESEELIDNISWNSSNSEESEDEARNPKKFKAYFPKFEQDMKLTVIKPIKINRKKEKYKKVKVDLMETIDKTTLQTEEKVINSEKKSPILNHKSSCIVKSESPIISQNYLFRETSPVITNREIIKKIRNKKRDILSRCSELDESPPDIFLSQKSKIIEENDSPNKTFSLTTNCSQELGSIELVSSQDSSSLVILNPSTSESSVQISELSDQCYHQPSPRRKNCKKNGLLHQLQKTLNLQKSRISLWHHDIFCKNVIPADLEHIKGVINSKWKDFGCTILKCSKVINDSNLEEIFLVSLGCNANSNLILNNGEFIKLFSPFNETLIQFEYREVKLYYNVFKILTESNENVQ